MDWYDVTQWLSEYGATAFIVGGLYFYLMLAGN